MNFETFYKNVENRLTDSILSLWATGDAETQNYLKYLFSEEKLLAEPVFQTTFPWEPHTEKFGDLSQIFGEHLIKALDSINDEEYRFSKDRFPYRHQLESWHTLINENKSIAVTTGTGSGKTECFMLPVLYDILKNYKNTKGVNAIFLYPLNALISSQKKRIDAWTRAIGGINYAIYNGNTLENMNSNIQRKSYPEILSRELIRKEPPQILFTNPTMLEYILVRDKDAELLHNSYGKLRWILLDEAHTLTGSAAAEMSLLIRRVLDAFGVTVDDVRFAATSATVGSDNDFNLQRFMSDLCGLPDNKIKIIKGRRILPHFSRPQLKSCTLDEFEKSSPVERCNYQTVHDLQKDILASESLKLSKISQPFNLNNTPEQLHLVDLLSESVIDDKLLFPVRGHFFVRGIGGVFVCTNPQCHKHKNYKPTDFIGTISTIAGRLCSYCGYPLLELVSCRSCGAYMLFGEQYTNSRTNQDFIQLGSAVTQDAFYIENEEEDEDEASEMLNREKIFISRLNQNRKYIKQDNLIPIGISKAGEILSDGAYIRAYVDGNNVCPHCGGNTNHPIHFRISASFINRVLADIILEQTPSANQITEKMLWDGHKYLSFTDSRQGTAKVSALINIDNESNWLRSQIFHHLAEKRKKAESEFAKFDRKEILQAIRQLEVEIENSLPILRATKEDQLNNLKILLESGGTPPSSESRISWKELYNKIISKNDLTTLYYNSRRYDGENDVDIESYLKSLFFDQFAKRLSRERSLENLGMVNIVYPILDKVSLPSIAKKLQISLDEWHKLLKISIDFVLRNYYHFYLPPNIKRLTTSPLKSISIFPSNTAVVNVRRWPKFDKNQKRLHRLSLLICAGLGLTDISQVDNILEDNINEILDQIWLVLRRDLLTHDGNTENDGYKINIEEKFSFELADNLWLCPVKKRLIDTHFKGYSPWITGSLSEVNISYFRINDPISFPYFPYPFNKNEQGELDLTQTKQWIEENCHELKKRGVWNSLLERIIQTKPLFLAGEHSAQQNPNRLKKLEEYFESGKLNILNCSTTMEMGVDIGGISAVVMNNVPPSPTNYLQRAGRAGRRSETKSITLTICAANPIGSNAMDNPLWALHHKIASPILAFNSPSVALRHLNAFFLGKFVQSFGGMNPTETIETFFFDENYAVALKFKNWLSELKVNAYEKSLLHLKLKTPFNDKLSAFLLRLVKENFDKILEQTSYKQESFKSSLKKLSEDYGESSPAYKAVQYQFNQFNHTHVIKYFAEEGFIPSAGFPTGVVNFDTTSIEDLKLFAKRHHDRTYKSNPSYHITRALTEFAPGNNIVIDGWNYVSAGVILKSEWNEARKDIIQSCVSCGFQRIVEIKEQNQITTICPHCNNDSLRGLLFANGSQGNFTELIEPTGFSIDLFQPPTRKISEQNNSQYIEPLLIDIHPWSNSINSIYDIRESSENAEILYYNLGNGNGFSICLHCGRTAFNRESLALHKRLRGGRDEKNNVECSGNISSHGIKDTLILGGRFKTDFCEIRFKNENGEYSNDETMLWSLGVVLTKTLTTYLGIEERELGFGVKRYDRYRSLFIFDTTKGGAGYSVKFSYYAEDVFKEALSKLQQCSCENACTKCLIDRKSQWYIPKLDRFEAIKWLEIASKQTVPKKLQKIIPNLQTVLGSIKEDIRRVKYRNDIEQIWFFIDHLVNEWDIKNWIFYDEFRKDNVDIKFVVNDKLDYSNYDQNIITAIQIQSWASFFLDKNEYNILKPLCQIQLKNGEFIIYYAEDFNNSFTANWGITANGYIYKTDDNNYLKLEKLPDVLPPKNNHDIFLSPEKTFSTLEFAKLFINELKDKINLKGLMHNESYDLVYSDRYLKSPLGCLLLIQFISGLRKEIKFEIKSLIVQVQKFAESKQPIMIYHNYFNSGQRNKELETISANNNIHNISVESGKLPHYRSLQFNNEKHTIIIRPDGGIDHGWFCVESTTYSGLTGKEDIKLKKGVDYPILYSVLIQ